MKRVRCRCPLCGMLVTQKRLNGEYEFEFKIQETGSKGRGKIYHIYRTPDNVEGQALKVFTVTLAKKLYQVADRLLEKVRAEGSEKRKKKRKAEAGEDKIATPVLDLFPALALDVSTGATLEGETEVEGAQKWQGFGDLKPSRSVEVGLRPGRSIEIKARTVLET